jgi:hypothetical protein
MDLEVVIMVYLEVLNQKCPATNKHPLHKKQTYLILPFADLRKVNQQNREPNTCMDATYYQLKKITRSNSSYLKSKKLYT